MKHLVLVGAGHAHVEVLRRFALAPVPGTLLTLLTRHATTPYSGMLHAIVAGDVPPEAGLIDCAALARHAGATLVVDEMIGIDLGHKQVLGRARGAVPFDVLSLDIGSTPNTRSVPGAEQHAIPVKPIDGFLERFAVLETSRDHTPRRIAVVGAGAAGVELCLAVRRRLGARATLTLVSGAATILPGFPDGVRERLTPRLARAGIEVVTGAPVVTVDAAGLTLADGRRVLADDILWATRAAASDALGDTGLSLDGDGFVRVDACLRAVGHGDVFAVGDIAAFDPSPLPKSGVYAVRQGPVLAANLRRVLTGTAPQPFRPQADALYLISTGPGHAVGVRGRWVFEGWWAKRLKTWLDTRFMARYPRPAPVSRS